MAMRCRHKYGERIFAGYVDVPDSYVVDPSTGETWPTCVFLAVLASSGYCFAQLCLKKDIDDWIFNHVLAFQSFGGTTKYLVPMLTDESVDLSKHVRYRDLLQRCRCTIEELNEQSALLKTDFRLVARWLVVAMCHHSFTGVSETNEALKQLIASLNCRQFKRLIGASRWKWFDTMERSYLAALPSMPNEKELWLRESVTSSYINVDQHYYSVPRAAIGHDVDIKVTAKFVEVFFQGRQVTSHQRQERPGKSTTKPDHVTLPNKVSGWSAQRVHSWAEKIGPATTFLIDTILTHANESPAGVRSCLGLLTLESAYGRERLESVCRHALSLKSWTVSSIRSMLKQGLDQLAVQLPIPNLCLPRKSSRSQKKRP